MATARHCPILSDPCYVSEKFIDDLVNVLIQLQRGCPHRSALWRQKRRMIWS